MKKLLIVLLALALVAGFAVAQDTATPAPQGQFHAWNYGILFGYASVDGGSPVVGWGPDWNPNNGIDQEWTFSYDGKDYGFAATFEFGMGNFGQSTNGWGAMQSFDTYYKLGKFAKVTIGQLDVGEYRYTTFVEGGANARFGGRAYAGMLQVYPIEGLSLAVLENVPGVTDLRGLLDKATTTDPTATAVNAANSSFGTYVSADYQDWTNLAASYEMKDVGKFYVAWNNTAEEATVGVNVSAIKPLAVQAVYNYDYTASGAVAHTIWLTAAYPLGDLSLAADFGFMDNTAGSYTAVAGELKAEYMMGQYGLGAKVGYDDGNGLGLFNGQAAGWTGLELYPYLKASYDNGSYITVGVLYASGISGAGRGGNSGLYGYSTSLLAIPIAYSWAF